MPPSNMAMVVKVLTLQGPIEVSLSQKTPHYIFEILLYNVVVHEQFSESSYEAKNGG